MARCVCVLAKAKLFSTKTKTKINLAINKHLGKGASSLLLLLLPDNGLQMGHRHREMMAQTHSPTHTHTLPHLKLHIGLSSSVLISRIDQSVEQPSSSEQPSRENNQCLWSIWPFWPLRLFSYQLLLKKTAQELLVCTLNCPSQKEEGTLADSDAE